MSMDCTLTPYQFGGMKWRVATPDESEQTRKRLLEWGCFIPGEDDLRVTPRDDEDEQK